MLIAFRTGRSVNSRPIADIGGLPDPSAMVRLLGIVIAFSAVGFALMANHYWSTTKYQLNGSTFNVPQRYNMMPYYRTRFTLKSRLVAEPDQTVSLILPAKELARDVRGYNELFHGYSGDVPAFITVTVSGGEALHDFAERYFAAWNQVRQLEEGGALNQPDPATGLERINKIPRGLRRSFGTSASRALVIVSLTTRKRVGARPRSGLRRGRTSLLQAGENAAIASRCLKDRP